MAEHPGVGLSGGEHSLDGFVIRCFHETGGHADFGENPPKALGENALLVNGDPESLQRGEGVHGHAGAGVQPSPVGQKRHVVEGEPRRPLRRPGDGRQQVDLPGFQPAQAIGPASLPVFQGPAFFPGDLVQHPDAEAVQRSLRRSEDEGAVGVDADD